MAKHSGQPRLTRLPLLTREEEIALKKAADAGDTAARERMILANIGLVANIARHYVSQAMPIEDLIDEGVIGLMRAVKEFDPGRGIRFSTYAGHWIRCEMRRAVSDTSRAVRIPRHLHIMLYRWRKMESVLASRLQRPPEFDEIADALQFSNFQRSAVCDALKSCMASGADQDVDHRLEGKEAPPEDGNEEINRWEEKQLIQGLINQLEPRERCVISLRFGLDSNEPPMTLAKIGARFGCTREWIRLIERRALRHLQEMAIASP